MKCKVLSISCSGISQQVLGRYLLSLCAMHIFKWSRLHRISLTFRNSAKQVERKS